MAKIMTAQDCHALMNLLVKEATGQNASITAVDTATFVSAGETVLATGLENTLNALSIVLGRTMISVRPYQAKLMIIQALNTNLYTNRMRKISYYNREAQASGWFNTDLATGHNLVDGYDNGSNGGQSEASMWVQNKPVPLEMNFAGQDTWQDSTTIYENQLRSAFRNESEFGSFVAGIMTEKANDLESQKEAYNRMAMLSYMAGVYAMDSVGSKVNLTAEFNAEMGTNYTSEELRTTYLKEFLEYFTARVKIDSDYMTERTTRYHWAPAKAGHVLLRHTPKSAQKLVLFSPLFTKAKSMVFPEIFNPNYLSMDNYEGVTYWQNINQPSKIKVTTGIPDKAGTHSGAQQKSSEVALDYVVGMMFDKDALMVDFQLETANTTPLEARKGYRNIWWTFSKNVITDYTENAIIYYMAD